MWSIQVLWAGVWVTVQRGFASKGDAEWATAKWKQANNCTGDPFMAFHDPDPWDDDPGPEIMKAAEEMMDGMRADDQRAEDEAVYQNELRTQLANRV